MTEQTKYRPPSFTLRLPRHCSSARSPSPRASRSCRSASEQCRRRATSPIWTPIARSWTRLSDGVTRTSLRARDLESAIEKYLEYVGSAQLDRSESIEDDEQQQAELASDLSEAFDDTVHSHSDKIEKLSATDFGPKSKVEEGAAVKLGGRFFVIAVSTGKSLCATATRSRASIQAPIYAELEGKRAGDAISFNGRELVIEAVA